MGERGRGWGGAPSRGNPGRRWRGTRGGIPRLRRACAGCRGGLRSGNGVSQSRGETGGRGARGEGTGTRAIALGAIEEGFGGGRARGTGRARGAGRVRGCSRLAHAAQKHLGRERAGLARAGRGDGDATPAPAGVNAPVGGRRNISVAKRAPGVNAPWVRRWMGSEHHRAVRAARRLLGDPRRDVVVHDGNRDARPAPRSARRRSGLCRGDARERRVETISNAPPRRKPSAAGESSAKSENCRRAARQLPHRPRCASALLASAHSAPAASLGPARIHHGFERRWR